MALAILSIIEVLPDRILLAGDIGTNSRYWLLVGLRARSEVSLKNESVELIEPVHKSEPTVLPPDMLGRFKATLKYDKQALKERQLVIQLVSDKGVDWSLGIAQSEPLLVEMVDSHNAYKEIPHIQFS